jgi:hypothetical protein
MRIGEYLVSKKLLTTRQVEVILDYSREHKIRFGEAGMELGFLSRESFINLYTPASDSDLFQVVPKFFPIATRNLIERDALLKYGVLPLGFKTRWNLFRGSHQVLNLGFLSPRKKDRVGKVQQIIESIHGIKDFNVFIILADQYISVLGQVYLITPEMISEIPESALDPTLKFYLEDLESTTYDRSNGES